MQRKNRREEAHAMIETKRGAFAIHSPRPDVHVIQVRGVLDNVAGLRLQHLVDARLTLIAAGRVPTRHLVLDLSDTIGIEEGALHHLQHAHRRATLDKIGLRVVGLDAAAGHLALPARRPVDRLSRFPTLDSALSDISAQRRAPQS